MRESAVMERILVVDDDPHIIGALARMLDDEFDVDTAATGREAINLLTTNTYSIVVSDMRMPDMCGTELLTHVYDNYPATARLLLTARYDAEVEVSMFAVLLKPCTSTKLTKMLKDAISWSRVKAVSSDGADCAANPI